MDELAAVRRTVGTRAAGSGEARTLLLRRRYQAPVDDVWDGVTDPDRLRRWFLPVTGEFRLGGSFQAEGNAGGEVLRCEPPRLLRVTWHYGEPAGLSEVEVRLSDAGDGWTEFALEHTATVPPEMWDQFGPGAVGIGWDLGLLGLAAFLRGEAIEDPQERAALGGTPEGQAFLAASSRAWGAAYEAAGADPADVARMVGNATSFYVPAAEEGSG